MRCFAAPRSLRVARCTVFLCTAASAFWCLGARPASGQDRLEREGRIKAALILNIAKLVTWPTGDTSELTVCVFDEAQLVTPLASIDGEIVQNRRVTVRQIQEASSATGCQIVFIGAGSAAWLDEVQAAVFGHPTLTVGDVPEFAERAERLAVRREHVRAGVAPSGPPAIRRWGAPPARSLKARAASAL